MNRVAAALALLLSASPATSRAEWALEQVDAAGAVIAAIPLVCEPKGCEGEGAVRGPYGGIPARVLLRRDLSPGRICLYLHPPAMPSEPWRWDCTSAEPDGGSLLPWRIVADDWLQYPPPQGMDRFNRRFISPWGPTWLDLRLRQRP